MGSRSFGTGFFEKVSVNGLLKSYLLFVILQEKEGGFMKVFQSNGTQYIKALIDASVADGSCTADITGGLR